jgi:branched-chain amino acid transport system substrate-binding protein
MLRKFRFISLRALALAAIAATAAAGCSSSSKSSSSSTGAAPTSSSVGSPTTATSSFGGTVKFGFVADTTGEFSQFGIPSYEATTLAISQINAAGGIQVGGMRYKVELATCQSEGTDGGAQACATQIVKDDGAKFVFGGISTLAPVVMRVTEPNNAIFFTSASSASAYLNQTKLMVTTLGNVDWRVQSSLLAIQKYFPNAKTIGLVAENDATLQAVGGIFKSVATKLGMNLVIQSVPTGTTDYSSALTALKPSKPDVLLAIINTPAQNTEIISANNQLDVAPAIFGYSGDCQTAINAGTKVPYVCDTLAGADLDYPTSPTAAAFAQKLKAWAGSTTMSITYPALWNYDFYFLLVKAIEAAGTVTDTTAIYNQLFNVSYDGVVGHIQFQRDTKEALYGFEMCYTAGKVVNTSDCKYINPSDYNLTNLNT